MPDHTPDPRATVELLTRLDAEMIGGEWYAVIAANQHPDFVEEVWDVETELSEDSTAFVAECGAIKCNKSRAHSHGIAALRNALPTIIRDLRRLVEVEAELERTRVKLHCYVAAADAEATFANESELQRLRAALKPFADRAESLRQLASDLDSTEARVCGTQPVPVQHLIAAAEALAHREGQ